MNLVAVDPLTRLQPFYWLSLGDRILCRIHPCSSYTQWENAPSLLRCFLVSMCHWNNGNLTPCTRSNPSLGANFGAKECVFYRMDAVLCDNEGKAGSLVLGNSRLQGERGSACVAGF